MTKNNFLSVSEFTEQIKQLLENTFPPVAIEGEISNYRPSSSGHIYFSLKDDKAVIQAVLFKYKSNLTFIPKDGMTVRIKGKLSVYPQRGNYQIIVDTMEEAGTGDILAMLEERKRRLAMEGLFDEENKRALPFFPRTVGVVTSPTGAALRDIMQIMKRRNPAISIIIFPCAVQGAEAAPQIVRCIQTANKFHMADVLIVGRGGGSIEDLLPFSDEQVVRAVAASEIPVVSAVGHEIDWALSDYAADRRAPTPSAGAELCTPLLSDVLETIDRQKKNLLDNMTARTEKARLLLSSFSAESLELRFRTIEQPLLTRLDDAKDDLLKSMTDKCTGYRQRIQNSIMQLEAADPKAILARGYSMVYDKETGSVIRSSQGLKDGQLLEIEPYEGRIKAEVRL
ncbi:MAG: exodeoxyribonuclease VII large subunit [Treponemataceae bacterium]|nr:exodeoxyribonuclease VII large subunit [Treponemataceae bacterium]